MTRLFVLLLVVASFAPAAPALAQSNPFGPLPPSAPAPTPTPEEPAAPGDDDISRDTMFLIAVGVILVFFVLGWAITRDARRSLTDDDRRQLEREERRDDVRQHQRRSAKSKARQKAKRQRDARKRNR